MNIEHTIEVEGLPEGWKPVAYKKAKKGEKLFMGNEVLTATHNHDSYSLVVEKIKPRRIVLESTGRVGRPEEGEYVQNNENFCKCRKPEHWGDEHEIWREVKKEV